MFIIFGKLIDMTKEQSLADFLDSQDFYELMQAYRHTPLDAAKEFEAVRLALYAAIALPEQLTRVVPNNADADAMNTTHGESYGVDWEYPNTTHTSEYLTRTEPIMAGKHNVNLTFLPCPFCGGNDLHVISDPGVLDTVFCNDCGTCGPFVDSAAAAIEAWNKRAVRSKP